MQTLKTLPVKKPFWGSIYEVIDYSYVEVVKLFPTTFLDHFKNYPNEPQNIPPAVKEDLKIMAMEQGLNVKAVMIRRRES